MIRSTDAVRAVAPIDAAGWGGDAASTTVSEVLAVFLPAELAILLLLFLAGAAWLLFECWHLLAVRAGI